MRVQRRPATRPRRRNCVPRPRPARRPGHPLVWTTLNDRSSPGSADGLRTGMGPRASCPPLLAFGWPAGILGIFRRRGNPL